MALPSDMRQEQAPPRYIPMRIYAHSRLYAIDSIPHRSYTLSMSTSSEQCTATATCHELGHWRLLAVPTHFLHQRDTAPKAFPYSSRHSLCGVSVPVYARFLPCQF